MAQIGLKPHVAPPPSLDEGGISDEELTSWLDAPAPESWYAAVTDGEPLLPIDELPEPVLSDEGRRQRDADGAAIQAWNEWLEINGMPGDDLRRG